MEANLHFSDMVMYSFSLIYIMNSTSKEFIKE